MSHLVNVGTDDRPIWVASHYVGSNNFSGRQLMEALREFKSYQPAHDLSVLRRKYYGEFVESETEVIEEPVKRKGKRNNG